MMAFTESAVYNYKVFLVMLITAVFGAAAQHGIVRVKSSCTVPTNPKAYIGASVNVTCNFSENLLDSGKSFRVYHYSANDPNDEEDIVDCYWQKQGQLKCVGPSSRYHFDQQVSDSLTITINEASTEDSEMYACTSEPSYPEDIAPCYLQLQSRPVTAPPGDNSEEMDSKGALIGIIIGAVLGGAVVLVIVIALFIAWRKGRLPCLGKAPGEAEREKVNNDVEAPAITTATPLLTQGERAGVEMEENIRNDARESIGLVAPSVLEDKECRLLIIGKTGSGKSTLGNMVLGEKVFDVGKGIITATKQSETKRSKRPGSQGLQVMDTPDVTNLDSDWKTTPDEEVARWKEFMENTTSASAIVLAISCGEGYTPHDFKAYEKVRELWGDSSPFCQRLVVAFTFGDKLPCDIKDFISNASDVLKQVLKDANGRYVVFNEKAQPEEKKESVNRLCTTVLGLEQAATTSGSSSHEGNAVVPDGSEDILLVVGKTGNGRSSVGNTLLERKVFETGCGMASTTKKTQKGKSTPQRGKRNFMIIDTPDVSDTDFKEKLPGDEVSEWKRENPHAILLTIRCDVRYTAEEYEIYEKLKSLWGDSKFFCKKLIVVFTFGDRQERDIAEELKEEIPGELRSVLNDAEWRYIVLNNKAKPEVNAKDISKLVGIVKSLRAGASSPGGTGASSPGGTGATSPGPQGSILIVGKTGNGRSSVGNTLLGESIFKTGCGMSSTTLHAEVGRSEHRPNIKVVDTPDISESDITDPKRKQVVDTWKSLADPGPDVILLTIRCDVRYTAEEFDIYKQLKKLWGDDSYFKKRLVVAFTFGDRQDCDIEEELKTSVPDELKKVLKDAGNRYVVFDNKADPEVRKQAVDKVMKMLTLKKS